MDIALFGIAVILSFSASYFQGRQLKGSGTDHQTHIFLINLIRENGHRLFSRVPRLLNENYCGGCPLFLHWMLSYLKSGQIEVVSELLNPTMNAAYVVFVYAILKQDVIVGSNLSAIAGLICLTLALTPQFYLVFNARNKGISARPIGINLFLLYAFLIYCAHSTSHPKLFFILAVITAYLIWGFSTFAQQAMLLFGAFFGIVWGNWTMMGAALSAMALFWLIHPGYGGGYLKHTFLFIKTYATKLAKIFILKLRYSIWRDLVYDIWLQLSKSPKKGFIYAYQNSLLIILFLNPLVFITPYLIWRGGIMNPFIVFCIQISSAGLAAFILTSFRVTRFLGEPERYIEMVTAFSSTVGTWYLFSLAGLRGVLILMGYFLAVNAAQFLLILKLKERVTERLSDFSAVEDTITREFQGDPVRFASNNEEWTRRFMTNPWSFVSLVWCVEGRKEAGFSLSETFSVYPYVNKKPFELILEQFQINAFLLDKSNFSEIFEDHSQSRQELELLLDTESYRLYRLDGRPSAIK